VKHEDVSSHLLEAQSSAVLKTQHQQKRYQDPQKKVKIIYSLIAEIGNYLCSAPGFGL
jgi:hypothetical protein